MPGHAFKECQYSAFISYAHADDAGWNDWVSCFNRELEMTLPARLRGVAVPHTHLSGKNGPIAGDLEDALRARIAASFVMILMVHDNYAESGWCQHELAYFKSLFGDEGFRERLYIVAMSKSAIEQVTTTEAWKRVCPSANLVWMPFYQADEPEMPIVIYSDRGIVANAFWNPFVKLREDLVRKIKASMEPQPRAPMPTPMADGETVRIYIESNRNEIDHWETIGVQAVATWDKVVAGMALAPPLYVRPSGLPMDRIDQFPYLDDADGVILLWGQKTSDSLVAQIKKVEGKLPGRDFAPGVVACLIPPQGEMAQAVSAFGWPVVRFKAPAAQGIEVLPQDAPRFEAFLRKVLARKKQREAAPPAALAVPP